MKALRTTAVCLAVTLFVSGCAAPNGGNPGPMSQGGDADCNAAMAAVGGALAGALIAKLSKQNAGKGAVIGGGLAALACVAFNAKSQQVKTAQAVEADYQRRVGALPPTPTLVGYTSAIPSGRTIKAGGEIQTRSEIEVVTGRTEPISQVKETIALYKPDGSVAKRGEKILNEKTPGSAKFENSFTFTMPAGLPQGIYGVQTAVVVNGKTLSQELQRVQLVMLDDGRTMTIAAL